MNIEELFSLDVQNLQQMEDLIAARKADSRLSVIFRFETEKGHETLEIGGRFEAVFTEAEKHIKARGKAILLPGGFRIFRSSVVSLVI